jgi:hypothetical protein
VVIERKAKGKRMKAKGRACGLHFILHPSSFILLLFLFGCDQLIPMPDPRGNMPDSGPAPVPGASAKDYAAFVVTTDYSLTSGFAVIDLDTRVPYLPDPSFAAGAVSPDPAVTAYGGYIFVINRYTYDNITVLDRSFNLVNQYSVADASCPLPNPQALAFTGLSKAYLTRYGCTSLLVLNPLTGQRLGTIDVPPEDIDSDGLPEMSGLLLHGNTLYVALQKLDRIGGPRNTWPPTDNSLLMMVDTSVDLVAGAIILTGKNPVTDVVYDPLLDRILVGDVGLYFNPANDGGIEAVNPSTYSSEGYLLDEAALAGQIGDFVIAAPDRGYVSVTDNATWTSRLYRFNPSTHLRDPLPLYSSPSDFALGDIALNDRGELYLCDRRATGPGLAIIDTATDTLLTPAPISTWLPPFALVFLK